MARSLQEVENEIAQIQEELKDVHGTETEVYARIVGYYRAVRNWNNGKKDEFNHRRLFELNKDCTYTLTSEKKQEEKISENAVVKAAAEAVSTESSDFNSSYNYEIFTRRTCPNCPAVKDYMNKSVLKGRNIDVDTEEGFAEAAGKGVFAAPTVIFYNADGQEISRAHTVEELAEIFSKVFVEASA